MLSAESHTITNSDKCYSGYDTDDEPYTISNEYGGSRYDGSDEYDFECNDERSREESDPYDEECYGGTQSVEINGRDNESYKKTTIENLMKMVACTATVTILQVSTTVRTMLALYSYTIS